MLSHPNNAIFKHLPSPFVATRYHSLVVSSKSLPECLNVLASSNDEIMAIKHKQLPIYGIQFHPEAHLTSYGLKIIQNFFDISYERTT